MCTVSEDSDSAAKMSIVKSTLSLVAPRKRKKVTTLAQALSQLSTSLESHKERMEMWLMVEQKREEAYLKYQERQSKLNRQHELCMGAAYCRSSEKRKSPTPYPSHAYPLTYRSTPPAFSYSLSKPKYLA